VRWCCVKGMYGTEREREGEREREIEVERNLRSYPSASRQGKVR